MVFLVGWQSVTCPPSIIIVIRQIRSELNNEISIAAEGIVVPSIDTTPYRGVIYPMEGRPPGQLGTDIGIGKELD
jgi:hypothetical protein